MILWDFFFFFNIFDFTFIRDNRKLVLLAFRWKVLFNQFTEKVFPDHKIFWE